MKIDIKCSKIDRYKTVFGCIMYIACRKETYFIKGNYIIILQSPLFLELKNKIKSGGSEQS